MRKKIAFFAGGWSGDFIQNVLDGVIRVAEREDTDVFAFLNYSLPGESPVNEVEMNLYKLPDMREFDGVILPGNSYNQREEREYLISEIQKYNIPCISIEYPFEGMPYISTDNYTGMYSLVEHMIQVHKIKNVLYISGPEDHPEAQERLRAFKSAMTRNDVPIAEDGIRYGDWAKEKIPGFIEDWLEEHGSYPDAIICANDIMAIATYNYLSLKKIRIPREVKVTGYDCTRLAQAQHPPIASVSHEWNTMGTIAAENLLARMAGKITLGHIKLNTKFVPGGSCGCHIYQENESINIGKALTQSVMDPIDMDSHFRHFYTNVRKAKNHIDVHRSLSYLFEHNHLIEGEQFRLFLEPDFFDVSQEVIEPKEITIKDEYAMIVDIQDGKAQPYRVMSRHDCIFEIAEKAEAPGYYVFVTVYSDMLVPGFAMMSGALNVANESQYYIWTRHMNSALEQVRTNMLVTKLWDEVARRSIRDALTGAYNRHGCEQNTYPMLINWAEKGGSSVIMIVDVDNMKTINDKYGHSSGDEALVYVTEALRKGLPEGFQVSRYGGDEFFVGGVLENAEVDIDKLVENVETILSEDVEKGGLEYSLTMSIGCAKVSPQSVVDIEKALVIADKNMYARKDVHHKRVQA